MAPFKILIVEDEAVIAMELEARLNQLGYQVIGSASSSDSALQKIETMPPDLVLMDIHITGAKDGIETAEEVRTRYNIPVIYLTAYADGNTLQRAKLTIPFGYLLKPFREEELRTTIEMAIHKHRTDEYLRQQAIIDALTGLYNRRYLDEALPREFHRARRNNSELSVAMLDIDKLKSVNDTYGHDAGDHMIRHVAEMVQLSMRKSDLVCRYGGDEIALVLPDTPLHDAVRKMEELIAQIRSSPLHIGEVEVKITVSIGVAAVSEQTRDWAELLREADHANYHSKHSGRDAVSAIIKRE